MKTTSQSAAINRLNKVANKNTVAYRMVLDSINTRTEVIRPVYTSGSGKHTSNQNHTMAVTSLLNQIGIKFTKGNDAPRGGEVGIFVRIVTKIRK